MSRLIAALVLSLAAACAAPKRVKEPYPVPEPLETAWECVNRTDGSPAAVEWCLCWVQSDQSDSAAERCSGESY